MLSAFRLCVCLPACPTIDSLCGWRCLGEMKMFAKFETKAKHKGTKRTIRWLITGHELSGGEFTAGDSMEPILCQRLSDEHRKRADRPTNPVTQQSSKVQIELEEELLTKNLTVGNSCGNGTSAKGAFVQVKLTLALQLEVFGSTSCSLLPHSRPL